MKQLTKDQKKAVLRISLSLVFLYFGFSQIYSPSSWTGFVPEFLINAILTVNNLVILNGILEITLGIFLLLGLYTRISSLILALHLFGITASLGFSPLAVRDFGLSVATLIIFFNGEDIYCLDKKF